MAKNTSFILGDHFDAFVASQVEAGRYSNATDVIRSPSTSRSIGVVSDSSPAIPSMRRILSTYCRDPISLNIWYAASRFCLVFFTSSVCDRNSPYS